MHVYHDLADRIPSVEKDSRTEDWEKQVYEIVFKGQDPPDYKLFYVNEVEHTCSEDEIALIIERLEDFQWMHMKAGFYLPVTVVLMMKFFEFKLILESKQKVYYFSFFSFYLSTIVVILAHFVEAHMEVRWMDPVPSECLQTHWHLLIKITKESIIFFNK